MQYNLPWLLDQYTNNETLKFLFFWGHTPSHGETVGPWCLSQWFERPFLADGITFQTAEHYMMAKKALLFCDDELQSRIIAAKKPGEAKALGREINNFDESFWNAHKFDIVVEGNRQKFSQHEDLKAYLVGTGDRILVEASPVDRIWGIGLGADHPDAYRVDRWQGENLLGFALMEVRDLLLTSNRQ
jgi:ribA/ribD-fused uncharacterized protein